MDLEQPTPEAERLARVIAHIDRPVVLVGMMGVGKSSLGRKLAAQLRAPFVDADDEIEKAAQMAIPEIFATYGEAFFRQGERRVIARLLGECDSGSSQPAADQPALGQGLAVPAIKVIATGGGAFCNAETRALIRERSIPVWLDAELDTLVERTARKDNRPLLRGGNPRDILARLKAEREPFYAEAPIKVMSGNAPHHKTLARLMIAIDQWLASARNADGQNSGSAHSGTPLPISLSPEPKA